MKKTTLGTHRSVSSDGMPNIKDWGILGKTILIFGIVFLISGCLNKYSLPPYQPFNTEQSSTMFSQPGYDEDLDEKGGTVTYYSNGFANVKTVANLALLRVAELTVIREKRFFYLWSDYSDDNFEPRTCGRWREWGFETYACGASKPVGKVSFYFLPGSDYSTREAVEAAIEDLGITFPYEDPWYEEMGMEVDREEWTLEPAKMFHELPSYKHRKSIVVDAVDVIKTLGMEVDPERFGQYAIW